MGDEQISVVEISDKDIKDAFKELKTYIDISPEDFKEIYLHALKHAVERISCGNAKISFVEGAECKR